MSIRKNAPSVTLDIVEFTKKGHGLGYFERQDGTTWPAETPFTIPGDQVKAILTRKRSGLYGTLVEDIVKDSPDRISPRCQHFGSCGGCRWQQISYEKQLLEKEEIVKRHFRSLLNDQVDFRPILPSPSPWNYRNKMEYSFSSDAAGNKYLGLMLNQGRGKVFHLTECHLPNPWFVDAVQVVREWWNASALDAYHPYRNTGHLRTLTLREGQRTGDRMVNLTVSGNPDFALKKHHLESFVAFVRDKVELVDPEKRLSIFITIQQAQKGQPTRFFEMHLYGPDHIRETLHIEGKTLTFSISPMAFFQPNTAQAENLYTLALKMANFPASAVVYDLYCGTGTLGICAAKRAKQVVGIELSRESSHDARHNAKENGLDNIAILTGSVEEKLEEIRKEELYPQPDLVMVDPPRAGLDPRALKLIAELGSPKILYISCNPATQAENIQQLVQQGYRLEAVQPVDQFPQTVHIENIALLTK